jgi:flagellar biosynthesis protein FliR
MINLQITDYSVILAFWLSFTRWLTILFQIPLFDSTAIPGIVKTLAILVITYAFFPYVQPMIMKDIAFVGPENFWYLTIFYTIVGLLIGYIVKSIMGAFLAGGSVITQQMGFGAIRYFDPNAAQSIGPFEKIIQWTLVVLILSSGALIPMFKGVIATFHSFHLYDLGKFAKSPEFFLEFFNSLFLAALMLSTPLIFTNILIMVILGIIARTVPQMNVLMVSFVVNIGLGLLVFIAISDEFFQVAFRIYTEKLGQWFQFVI